MNNRENLMNMLNKKNFDYYPSEFLLCPDLQKAYEKNVKSNLKYSEYFNFNWSGVGFVNYPEQSKIDWKKYYDKELDKGVIFDSWGVAHEPGGKEAKHMTRMSHPLGSEDLTLDDLKAYPYPDISKANIEHLKKNADWHHENGQAALGVVKATLWEVPWYIRSMEELMMDMMEEDEMAIYHFERCLEMSIFEAEQMALAGCDVIHTGDDVGMQKSLMLSEDLYRAWIKPAYKKLVAAIKKINPNCLVSYHSCGYIEPFIDDIIEVGIDVLNPIQPECMDFKEIHDKYSDKIAFWGSIGTQTTMPFGKPEDVRKEVLKNLEIAGDKGGFICAPSHLLEPEVPWENIIAYVDAMNEFNKVNFNYTPEIKGE